MIIEMQPSFIASRLYLDGQLEYLSEDTDAVKKWVPDISMAKLFSNMKEVIKYFSSDILHKGAMGLVDGTVIFPTIKNGTLDIPIKISKIFVQNTENTVCS